MPIFRRKGISKLPCIQEEDETIVQKNSLMKEILKLAENLKNVRKVSTEEDALKSEKMQILERLLAQDNASKSDKIKSLQRLLVEENASNTSLIKDLRREKHCLEQRIKQLLHWSKDKDADIEKYADLWKHAEAKLASEERGSRRLKRRLRKGEKVIERRYLENQVKNGKKKAAIAERQQQDMEVECDNLRRAMIVLEKQVKTLEVETKGLKELERDHEEVLDQMEKDHDQLLKEKLEEKDAKITDLEGARKYYEALSKTTEKANESLKNEKLELTAQVTFEKSKNEKQQRKANEQKKYEREEYKKLKLKVIRYRGQLSKFEVMQKKGLAELDVPGEVSKVRMSAILFCDDPDAQSPKTDGEDDGGDDNDNDHGGNDPAGGTGDSDLGGKHDQPSDKKDDGKPDQGADGGDDNNHGGNDAAGGTGDSDLGGKNDQPPEMKDDGKPDQGGEESNGSSSKAPVQGGDNNQSHGQASTPLNDTDTPPAMSSDVKGKGRAVPQAAPQDVIHTQAPPQEAVPGAVTEDTTPPPAPEAPEKKSLKLSMPKDPKATATPSGNPSASGSSIKPQAGQRSQPIAAIKAVAGTVVPPGGTTWTSSSSKSPTRSATVPAVVNSGVKKQSNGPKSASAARGKLPNVRKQIEARSSPLATAPTTTQSNPSAADLDRLMKEAYSEEAFQTLPDDMKEDFSPLNGINGAGSKDGQASKKSNAMQQAPAGGPPGLTRGANPPSRAEQASKSGNMEQQKPAAGNLAAQQAPITSIPGVGPMRAPHVDPQVSGPNEVSDPDVVMHGSSDDDVDLQIKYNGHADVEMNDARPNINTNHPRYTCMWPGRLAPVGARLDPQDELDIE